jgi:hypothetical protein
VVTQFLALLGAGIGTSVLLDKWAGHEFPIMLVLTLFGSVISYIYSAPPLKLKQSGWIGNYALGSSYIALPWWAGQVGTAAAIVCFWCKLLRQHNASWQRLPARIWMAVLEMQWSLSTFPTVLLTVLLLLLLLLVLLSGALWRAVAGRDGAHSALLAGRCVAMASLPFSERM